MKVRLIVLCQFTVQYFDFTAYNVFTIWDLQ